MTTPTQAGVLAILDGCITPQNKLRMAIIRAYIEGQNPVDMETLKGDVWHDLQNTAPNCNVAWAINWIIDHLAAQGVLHSADKIILNREDVPEGLDDAIRMLNKWPKVGFFKGRTELQRNIEKLTKTAALVAKAKGA